VNCQYQVLGLGKLVRIDRFVNSELYADCVRCSLNLFRAVECFPVFRCRMSRFDRVWRPFRREELMDALQSGCPALPMSARQADSAHFPNVGLSRYLVLAHRQRARNHWSIALVAGVSGEVKVLFSQWKRLLTERTVPYASPS